MSTLLEWGGPRDVSRQTRAVEAAYIQAAEQEYGPEFMFWARVDASGAVEVAQVLQIVENVADERREVKLADIITSVPDAKLNTYVVNQIDPVPPSSTQLKAAQTLATVQNVRISVD